jgi:hypothetical protein
MTKLIPLSEIPPAAVTPAEPRLWMPLNMSLW